MEMKLDGNVQNSSGKYKFVLVVYYSINFVACYSTIKE